MREDGMTQGLQWKWTRQRLVDFEFVREFTGLPVLLPDPWPSDLNMPDFFVDEEPVDHRWSAMNSQIQLHFRPHGSDPPSSEGEVITSLSRPARLTKSHQRVISNSSQKTDVKDDELPAVYRLTLTYPAGMLSVQSGRLSGADLVELGKSIQECNERPAWLS
jgi:hypothetical protein